MLHSIRSISAREWDALHDGQNPFLRHAFLAALEDTGCIGAHNGWEPRIFTLRDARGLAAAAPAYLKRHSFGEFVFDFSWAQAYARSGLPYYPKLVIAIPFTPVSGARLLMRAGVDANGLRRDLLDCIVDYAREYELSSAHLLFGNSDDLAAAAAAGLLPRQDCQFHWRNAGYRDFEHYLAGFTAAHRKKTRQERRYVQSAGVTFETRHGDDIGAADIARVHALIERTFHQRGHEPYVSAEFLTRIARELGPQMMLQLARQGGDIVGCAVYFRGGDTLYGRYWGSDRFINCLHFETCYYRGIDYCIEHGIQHFDPGVQGEHKIKRGFGAHITRSAHWIADERFREAIRKFLAREAQSVEDYAMSVEAHLPFRQ